MKHKEKDINGKTYVLKERENVVIAVIYFCIISILILVLDDLSGIAIGIGLGISYMLLVSGFIKAYREVNLLLRQKAYDEAYVEFKKEKNEYALQYLKELKTK